MNHRTIGLALAVFCYSMALAQPVGEVQGSATRHTAASARAAIDQGWLVLPASATGGPMYAGPWRDAPPTGRRVPVVVFLHGSSGLGLKAIGEWQAWLAGLGVASFAPDSFALPQRLTYKSPVAQDLYEQIHALRLSEVELSLQALRAAPWADTGRMVLAGTSEGAVAVARYAGPEFAGQMIFSWSCEDNYFVRGHGTALPPQLPVLNVISSAALFFFAVQFVAGQRGRSRTLRGSAQRGQKREHRAHPGRAAHADQPAAGAACDGRLRRRCVEALSGAPAHLRQSGA